VGIKLIKNASSFFKDYSNKTPILLDNKSMIINTNIEVIFGSK